MQKSRRVAGLFCMGRPAFANIEKGTPKAVLEKDVRLCYNT